MLWSWQLCTFAALFLCKPTLAGIDPRIQTAYLTDTPINGVSTTPDGRVFFVYARVDQSKGYQVVEWDRTTNTTTPIPNAEWNSYTAGADPSNHLIRTNSQRVGPDGCLWIVDTGSPSFGEPVMLPIGPKLVQYNLTSNSVQRVYPMGDYLYSTSLMDDIRFHTSTGKAYLTDAGYPGLIVLDLATGNATRVLNNDPSTIAYFPASLEGNFIGSAPPGSDGLLYVDADQLEVSPDGTYFYWSPTNGGLHRIETQYLDKAFNNASFGTNNEIIGKYVEVFAQTPPTGGTAIDAQGSIYSSDTNLNAIEKVWSNGTREVYVQDDRLVWVDAMWIDANGTLWMPAAQLGYGAVFNNGTNKIQKPLSIFTIDIGVGPSPIDHA